MNIFKKSRKLKEEEDASRPYHTNDVNGFTKASRALTRKKKKEVEEKPVFDLSSALPDRDEFRTSLLMPNLSARFSMLREQDDPTTKIGKASDDSVLFPKQTSRHNLLNSITLSDIAEVESIHSTFRPPFADDDRKLSSSDGYVSDNGSIMNRSRPVETNNLFGGRQKVYKVTASSSSKIVGNKHLYGSDVSLPTFQQSRTKAKEYSDSDENTDRSSVPISDLGETDSMRSPLTGYNKNRGTQSSTNSAPSHRPASTAATSVMSESPAPHSHSHLVINKIKEQDANFSSENVGFATSSSSHKPEVYVTHRTGSPTSRSAVNAGESSGRQTRGEVSAAEIAVPSPSNTSSHTIDFLQKDAWKPLASPSRFQATSPTAQFNPDPDGPLASNVRPNDRGKATAMGLFNKPARHYDEAQFSQRQVQLHQGRISPPSTRSRAASSTSPESTSLKPQEGSTTTGQIEDTSHAVQVLRLPDNLAALASSEQLSIDSSMRQVASRPRAKSTTSNKEASVKARLESLTRKQNEELAAMEAAQEEQLKLSRSEVEPSGSRRNTGKDTIFSNDSEEENLHGLSSSKRSSRPSACSTRIHNPPAPLEIHPAFRQDFQDFDFGTELEQASHLPGPIVSTTSESRQSADKSIQPKHASANSVGKLDSPTVPTTGLGLSGLIRTHLRQESANSSMLAPPSPALPVDQSRSSMASTPKTAAESVKSDPFDLDKDHLNVQQSPQLAEAPPTPTTAMSQHAQHILGIATAIREANANTENTPRVGASHDRAHIEDQDEDETEIPNHQRNESTETEIEQRRFEEELATRRQRIDAKLQKGEEISRSRSPWGERGVTNVVHGFSLPRLPIRSNTADRTDPQGGRKATRTPVNASVNREQATYMSNQPPSQGRDLARANLRPPTAEEYEVASGRRTPTLRPTYRHDHMYDRNIPPRSITPSGRPGTQNRSASNADRSVSRNGYFTDFDPVKMPGAFPGSPIVRRSPPREHGYRPESPAQTRSFERSASRNDSPYLNQDGYNNMKSLSPPHLNRSLTPRESPRPSPKPINEVFNQHQMVRPMSPPSSALPSPNPTMMGQSNGRMTPTAVPGRVTPSGTRKRSVNKGMISDPTFVSSTSSVPLVYLPRDGGPPVEAIVPPPIPAMNPRRRGNTADEQPSPGFGPHPAVKPSMASTPNISDPLTSPDLHSNSSQLAVQPLRQRNRIRKSSSEGGNMAARARQQALMAEMAREKERSPNVSVFPNRSATSLATPHDGGMF